MEYKIAEKSNIKEIIEMKNQVRERVIKEKLPIWKNGYPLDEMIYEDVNNKEARIVVINQEIVAYACFHSAIKEYGKGIFKKDNLYSFSRVMVKDGFTGKHIGDFLISHLIEEAKKLDVEGMGILVDACNIKAVSLYRKHHFIKEGEKEFPFAYLDIYGLYF